MEKKFRLLLLLALLMTAATGAWAQETLLLTINSRDYVSFKSGSMTFDDKVTVTFSNSVFNDDDDWGWYTNKSASLLTVAGTNGYTITSCKFYVELDGPALTGYTIEGESPSVYLYGKNVYTDDNQSVYIGTKGITKIEVYTAAAPTGYTVSLKDGVKDAGKWTVKVGEGQAQALPIGGLKGDGSETVTLQYNGRLKVKGVTATSDEKPAAPASTTLNNTIKAWTAGSYAVPAGGLTYSDAITVSGDVTLTLTDGETLTLNKGISLASGATLTVEGNGTMVVNGTNNSTASTVAGSTGTLILTSGTLTATGGNGGNIGHDADDSHGGNGGVAINGSVIVSGGTLTARGGNGGSVDYNGDNCSGGNGGDAISGTLTKNGGSTSVNDGSNGSIGPNCDFCTAGKGGKGHN